jgi:ATPase family associated with various cellular activities (AAA)
VTPGDALRDRLAELRQRTARLVAARSADDPTAGDPLRGLHLPPEAVQRLLEAVPPHPADAPRFDTPSPGAPSPGASDPDASHADASHSDDVREDRLRALGGRFGLTELDLRLLLLALAPDLDRGFEQLYGYLNDDVTRTRATAGLALDLCGLPADSAPGRARLHPSAPLLAAGLLVVEQQERPFLSRTLTVPDRVVAHLLGDDTRDALLPDAVRLLLPPEAGTPAPPLPPGGLADRLSRWIGESPLPAHLREQRPGAAVPLAVAALHLAGLDALYLDCDRLPGPAPGAGPEAAAAEAPGWIPALVREARLRGGGIVAGPLPVRGAGPLVRALAGAAVPVLLTGTSPCDPEWTDRQVLLLEAPEQESGPERLWSEALGMPEPGPDGGELAGVTGVAGVGFDLAAAVAPYRLSAAQIRRAARAAVELAAFEQVPLGPSQLRRAALGQSASGLEQHSRRIRPAVGWPDLLLPAAQLRQLHELAQRARHRDRVLGAWGLRAGGGRGRGVVALFAGESGTGKTLAAEVVAADLGLDLYVVQLSAIVDKYVGETEKNLERVFSEADRVDAVLLFDEADAVFGKRSEVRDSHDRYANLESAYLLQRLESFDGVAVLTTNLRSNIDDAFTRRLDLVVDFPFPGPEQRLALWWHSLERVPTASELDPAHCAREFELSGGSVRSAVTTAAYLAAERGDAVTAADLLEGAQREYRKAGRLVLEDGATW